MPRSVRRNTVQVRWSGVERTQSAIRGVGGRVRAGVLDGLRAIALAMQNYARAAIQKGPKTGLIYRRRTVVHRASAPGEFPATDTGTLVRSVQGEVEEGSLEAIASASTRYAKWLEMGTMTMAPRPFLQPTLKWVSQKAGSILQAAIKVRLNG